MKKSYQLELLDASDIPMLDLYQNLKELNFINSYLGGHDITISGIKQLLKDKSKTYRIADVACGGGDSLKAMAIWARKNDYSINFVGIDLKPDCITYAKNHCKDFPEISFITSDYKLVHENFDITTCALFCHHLTDNQVVEYLCWCKNQSKMGFVINDLERNFLAKWSIKILTSLFSKSFLVKNDAPLSVQRGFVKKEWKMYLEASTSNDYAINWKWAFRHLIICKN